MLPLKPTSLADGVIVMQGGGGPSPSLEGQRRVAIVGFGYVGTIIGAYLASRGFLVTAIESRDEVVEAIEHGEVHIREVGLSEVLLPLIQNGSVSITRSLGTAVKADTVIITVGTPLGRGRAPDLSALNQVASELAPHLQRGQLVILKSTIPPGTTRDVIAPLLESTGLKAGVDFYLAYCPERLAEGNALQEVPQLPVVVSGLNDASAESAERFWRAAGLETVRVGSVEAAELVKLADNVWIDLTIALTNELARVCERLGVDALDVIRAANTLKKGQSYVNYLHPGIGVGGSCLTKDPWFFADLAASVGAQVRLPQVGRRVNEMVPSHHATTISRELHRRSAVRGAKVAILGYAFKGSTGDTRNTPVKRIVEQIRRSGWSIAIYDPWVDADQVRQECGVSPQPSLEACVSGASCVLVAANHPEFVGLKPTELRATAPGCIVFDGWHVLDPTEFVKAGFDYFSPGKNVGTLRA